MSTNKIIFIKTYVVAAHYNRLKPMLWVLIRILMSTHNIGFYEEISKIIPKL